MLQAPLSLWLQGWWNVHSQGPRRCTPPHVRAPATQLCTPWRPPPRRAPSGRLSSLRSRSRPGWDAPFWPTPCGRWMSSHSTWKWDTVSSSSWLTDENESALPPLTQWWPPTSSWSCLLRQTLCGRRLAWWLQMKHCGRGLETQTRIDSATVTSSFQQKTIIQESLLLFQVSSYRALFWCTQTPESPTAWCSYQLNMKPTAFLSGQKRCPVQSLCDPSGFAQSRPPHSPTPRNRNGQQQSWNRDSLANMQGKREFYAYLILGNYKCWKCWLYGCSYNETTERNLLQTHWKVGENKGEKIWMFPKKLCSGSVASDNASIRESPDKWAVTKQKKSESRKGQTGRGSISEDIKENTLRSPIKLWIKCCLTAIRF